MKFIASSSVFQDTESTCISTTSIHSDTHGLFTFFFREFKCKRKSQESAMSMSCLTAGTPVRGASAPSSSSSTDGSQYQVKHCLAML